MKNKSLFLLLCLLVINNVLFAGGWENLGKSLLNKAIQREQNKKQERRNEAYVLEPD